MGCKLFLVLLRPGDGFGELLKPMVRGNKLPHEAIDGRRYLVMLLLIMAPFGDDSYDCLTTPAHSLLPALGGRNPFLLRVQQTVVAKTISLTLSFVEELLKARYILLLG